nr:MAG TPA: hypothetical protein [Caudoviricetes sp.]
MKNGSFFGFYLKAVFGDFRAYKGYIITSRN